MKKTSVTAILLSFCLILTSFCTAAAENSAAGAEETVQIDSSVLSKAVTLEKLGIITSDAETFAAKEQITRAEIAEIAVLLSGYGNTKGGEDSAYFIDVPNDAKYKSAVGSAVKLGLMNGTGGYTFEPDRAISYTELIKVMLKVLGYEWKAEVSGGYPSGYLQVAAQTGLSKNVKNTDALNGEAVVKILYNALDTEMLIPTGFGKDIEYETYEGRTLLTENLKLEKLKGIVTAIPKTELYGESSLDDEQIMIDNTRVKYADAEEGLLGLSVTAYCGTEDDKDLREAVYVEVSDKNVLLEADGEDASYSDNEFKYYDDKDRQKTAVTKDGAAVIFNGRAISDPKFDMSSLAPDEGHITLIDNDGDGKYDVIKVHSHYNIRVEGIDTVHNIIFVKDGASIKTNDTDKWYFYAKDGSVSRLASVPNDAVLSVEESGDEISFYMGMDSFSGTVEKITGKKFIIDGIAYETSKSLVSDKIPKVGESGTFLRDKYGKIAFFDKGVGSINPGVVAGVKYSEEMDTTIKIRIFTTMSEVVTYEVADKITLDGEKVAVTDKSGSDNKIMKRLAEGAAKEPSTKFTSSVPYGQIIRYKVNSKNEIIEIDTAVEGAKETDASLRLVTPAKSSFYKENGMNFGGHTVIDGNTIVFLITCPFSNPEEDIKLTSSGSFADNITKTVASFSYSEDRIASDVLVVYEDEGSGSIENEQLEMLVDDCGQSVDSDENILKNVSGYYKGSYQTYAVKDGAQIDKEIVRGDLIRFSLNAKSQMTVVKHIYSAETNSFSDTFKATQNGVFGGDQSNLGWDISYRAAQGYIQHWYENSLVFIPAEDIASVSESSSTETFNMNGVNIYVYDKNDSRNPVYVGSKSDINTYKKYKNNASKVYIRTRFSNVETILVVK